MYAKEALEKIIRHAEEEYPDECCGALLGPSLEDVTRAVRLRNVAPRRRDAFEIDPYELDQVYEEAAKEGLRVLGVYHSHIEVGAYLSWQDREQALSLGEPTYPLYLVASVRGRHCDALVSYTWSGEEFTAASLSLPPR